MHDEDGDARTCRASCRTSPSASDAEAERDRLREELQQAQKLEAIGRLAGGVAHDFNNMLTAIKGYASSLLDELEPGSAAHDEAAQIRPAAEQASDLTRQLLAFSRKQVLEPQLVDLNALVVDDVGARSGG